MQRNYKKIWNTLILFPFILLLSTGNCDVNNKKFSEAECDVYIRDTEILRSKYIEAMSKKYQLQCDGTGGGFIHNINDVFVSFISNKTFTVDKARKLYIACCEELLKRINADEKIRPYLSHYPYTEKGITIHLAFEYPNGNWVKNNHVAFVYLVDEKIYYDTYNPTKKALQDSYEETYQEALKKVKEAPKADPAKTTATTSSKEVKANLDSSKNDKVTKDPSKNQMIKKCREIVKKYGQNSNSSSPEEVKKDSKK